MLHIHGRNNNSEISCNLTQAELHQRDDAISYEALSCRDNQLFVDWVKELGELEEQSNDFPAAIAQAASMNSMDNVDNIIGKKDDVRPSLEQAFSTASIDYKPEMLIHLIQAAPDYCPRPSSLMIWVAELGHERVIKALLDRGCSPNIRLPSRNMTPLICAASNEHTAICDLLITRGAENDASPRDSPIIKLAIASLDGGEVAKLIRKHGIGVMTESLHCANRAYWGISKS